jgi:glycosyltransferase involved in cell wall biosynthesis
MAKQQMSYFKNWWYQKFKILGELTYNYSDVITTLYNGNKIKQIELGADKNKIKIIPNGINPEKLKIHDDEKIEEIYTKPEGKVLIGLVGRVVPIKDIKTFIKSISYIIQNNKNIQVLIMGPTDEDEDYYEECLTLVKLLR